MAVKSEDNKNKGKITLDRNILVSIINLATKEINGVESVCNKHRPLYKRMFNRYDDGVEVKFEKNGALTIDVYINIYIGFNVPDIAFRVQENIRNSLATMVALKPMKINVHIVDVECDREASDA
ncbi:MAG TPA: Asp23/Gls24 family envelope stress response protein [Candidatus Caccovivens faecavium]|mgnify:FL=1|nr:Asp23/Gls24 family envelope stress response protein [Candidatus Caccovivens faecavium]